MRGLREVVRAPFAMLHEREFVGLLRLPLTANAIAMTLLAGFGWLVLAPLFARAFASEWWLLDGLRAARAETGAATWLLTCWLLLGPSLLDTSVGALHEPLRLASERRLLGHARDDAANGAPPLRLRERARILALALVALPFALSVSLLPWIGLPIVGIAGAAVAAIVWFEPPMAARGLDLGQRVRGLWRNRWRALGAGFGIQLAAAVPFVNWLALAAVATIAATASYLQFDKKQ